MIEKVLKEYNILVIDIVPITDNLYKINDGTRYYSLKRSKMPAQSLNDWLAFYEESNKKYFKGILHVYLTKKNLLYVLEDGFIFYLSPWIEHTEKSFDIGLAFELISQIHFQTKDNHVIDNEKLILQFEDYVKQIDGYSSLLLDAVEQFEQNHYMSPFELLICTEYKDLESVIGLLKQTIRKFIDSRKDKITWEISLCHGQLAKKHFISSDQLFIINWEKATYGHTFQDIFALMNDLISQHGVSSHVLIQSFSNYLNINELEMDELYLLIIYMLDCEDYLEEVAKYIDNHNRNYSLIKQIVGIQKIYRRLQFGLVLAEYVEDRELGLEETDN